MKKLLLPALFLSLISPLLADTAGTSTNAAPASTNAAPAAAADDLSQYKSADDLWVHINDLAGSLKTGLQNQDPAVKDLIPKIWASCDAFIRQYPSNPHVWDVKMLVGQIGPLAGRLQVPKAPTLEETIRQFDAIASDDAAPQDVRAEAASIVISIAMQPPAPGGASTDWNAVDARIADFQKKYGAITLGGDHPIVAMLRAQELGLLKQSDDTARYQSLLQKLSTDALPEVAAMANDQIASAKRLADLKTKPIDLKYTAVDGGQVDLSKLRGKVVLIDFWATWCPPCREMVPDIVAAYQKYHDKGFEIVGISLDQSKDALLLYTKANQMVWPEYFDGKGSSNDISAQFGIDSIPAMWLVDKNGMLVTLDGREDLAGQIEKLLAK
jgi:thiol-disulfide isomerase/thioredoxin